MSGTDVLTYKLGANNAGALPFGVSPHGDVTVIEPLDRETVSAYQFAIVVHAADNPELSALLLVHVSVTDVNDNMPVFHAAYDTLTISEDSPAGTSLAVVSATDADDASHITYSLTSNDADVLSTFIIDAQTGWLLLARTVDREQRDTYALRVTASDGAGGESSVPVHVRVLDVNDRSPEFVPCPSSDAPLHVSESAPTGTVITTLNVHDADLPPFNLTRLYIIDGDEQSRSCACCNWRTYTWCRRVCHASFD
jgi:hypothetical protein